MHKKLPAAAITDEKEKPLLSWRVAMLPFLEQKDLYEEFHLDEPWDSPHNVRLIERMPDVFAGSETPHKIGHTTYLAVVGENCGLLPTKSISLPQFTDGTSDSIILVQTSRDKAVPWTAPFDFQPNESNPFGDLPSAVCNGLLLDMSMRFIPAGTDAKALWSMFTRGAGD